MNWPASHRILRVRRTWRRLLLPLVVVSAMLTALVVGGQLAHADTTGATNPAVRRSTQPVSARDACLPISSTCRGSTPPPRPRPPRCRTSRLTATANTIADHGLASTDGNAVLSLGPP